MKIKDGPKMWYPGHANPKIRRATELCMADMMQKIEKRSQPKLTTGQYNAAYEAVESIVALLQEAENE